MPWNGHLPCSAVRFGRWLKGIVWLGGGSRGEARRRPGHDGAVGRTRPSYAHEPWREPDRATIREY